ncbi:MULTISPECIES: hypothetical protein [Pseudomonas aeruginosa group]|nr:MULTISPECIES: hypothetical protein [Pseudomonas aeruginosa group]
MGDANLFGHINIGDDAGFFGMAEGVAVFDDLPPALVPLPS